MMAHTAPVNIGVFFGLQGRVFTTSSASTLPVPGNWFMLIEAIKYGCNGMVAGGSEGLMCHRNLRFSTTPLRQSCQKNDTPHLSPYPLLIEPPMVGYR